MPIRTESVLLDLKLKIERKLEENEVICPRCNGTSIHIEGVDLAVISDGVYKLKDFGKHETIVGCNDCYYGIQKVCKHCQGLYGRRKYQCDCDGAKSERRYLQSQKDMEKWNTIPKISYKDALEKYTQLYIENFDCFVQVDCLSEELEWRIEEDEEIDIEHLRVYGTSVTHAEFDAIHILESACDNLHEDAYERASSNVDMNKMQVYLDEIAKLIESDTTTYHPNYNVGILLIKDDF
jgi:RNA polymerase subunit RPABC4/transcription elongation factor Spt4